MEQEAHRDDREDHWHLDKKVPVAFIVVLLGYGLAGMWFIADIKKDVEILKAANVSQSQRDSLQDKLLADGVALIRADMAYIRQQLDLLIRDGAKR